MTDFKPSQAQQNYFDWVRSGTGNCVLEAVAGAGKTTTILKGVEHMRGSVFIGAYNKKMSEELKVRVGKLQRPMTFANTFHGAGYSALRFAFKGGELKVDSDKLVTIAKVIAGNDRPDLAVLADGVAGIVSMAKQRGIGALSSPTDMQSWKDMIEHYALDENLPDSADIEKVIVYSQVVLQKSNANLDVIDFDDMVYLPLQRGLRMLQNDWVMIDEAQDTNPTRRALAAKMLRPGGRLVAVGDPHQAIFGFTGADNDSLDQIVTQFKCARMPLSVSYRCPKAVVKYARQWVNHIEPAETAQEGSVQWIQYEQMIKLLCGDIPETAVLCRNNKQLVQLFFRLVREGVPAKIEGKQIGEGLLKLAGRWKTRQLDVLRDRLDVHRNREIKKALDKKREEQADRINDQVDTLMVLIERAESQGTKDLEELKRIVKSMFEDNVGKGILVLCSVHKSKGLEWNNVLLLGREDLMPSKFAKQDWQIQQEINLIYVAVTRAKVQLIEVSLPPEKDGRR